MSGFCGLWRGIAFAPAPYLASVYTVGSSSGSKTPGLSHVQRKLAIAYDAPVNLKKWPSLNSERRTVRGTLSGLLRHAGGLHPAVAGKAYQTDIALRYRDHAARDIRLPVLSPTDAVEIAMCRDFP
jgi:hypothetical protein